MGVPLVNKNKSTTNILSTSQHVDLVEDELEKC